MYVSVRTFCAEEKSPCGSNPCRNGGECEDNGETYVCTCPDGFTGTSCDAELDPYCATHACQQEQACRPDEHVSVPFTFSFG
ncbi:hypothetical protein SRHO_G00255850 [Serrasalmus rhombeus]